jgi:hypothetical protein
LKRTGLWTVLAAEDDCTLFSFLWGTSLDDSLILKIDFFVKKKIYQKAPSPENTGEGGVRTYCFLP